MKRNTTLRAVMVMPALFAGLIAGFGEVSAEPMSISGQQDIGQLLTTAKANYDLAKEDAIILFEGEKQFWLPSGQLQTMVHRIVWVSTDYAIEHYADLRIPYDAEHREMKVVALRSWRIKDQKWTESGPTGQVETLPEALAKAPDYSGVREMMLLTDGVEIPCVLEVAYTISDREAFRKSADGMYLFSRSAPALRSEFYLGVPKGTRANYALSGNVPKPVQSSDEDRGLDIYTWTVENLPAAGHPASEDPGSYTPHVTWTTQRSWGALGKIISESFTGAMELDNALRDSVQALVKDAANQPEKVRAVANFVGDKTRLVDYDESFWFGLPRKATRTYETGYASNGDRAILAAALFKAAGFEVWPVYRGKGYGTIDEGVATLSRMERVAVWVSGEGVEGYYNPSESKLYNGLAPIYGKTIWLPGSEDRPTVRWSGEGETSNIEVRADLVWDSDSESWKGTGYYSAGGGFCPFDRMEGLNDEATNHLTSVISSVFEGAEVERYNPAVFDRFNVTAGLSIVVKGGKADDSGRIKFMVGNPSDGIDAMLPHDVDLAMSARTSPVRTAGLMHQTIRVKLKTDGFETVYVPADYTVTNDLGTVELKVEKSDDSIQLTRTITLNRTTVMPDEWSQYRTLLLRDRNEQGRMVLLKKS